MSAKMIQGLCLIQVVHHFVTPQTSASITLYRFCSADQVLLHSVARDNITAVREL